MSEENGKMTKKELVFEFMKSNSEMGFKQLQENFSQMNINSLRAYYSAWNAEKNGGRKARRARAPKLAVSTKDQKLILAFKKVIERQERLIENQADKISALQKERKMVEGKFMTSVQGLSSKQTKEVLALVDTFAKGLKG